MFWRSPKPQHAMKHPRSAINRLYLFKGEGRVRVAPSLLARVVDPLTSIPSPCEEERRVSSR